MNIHSEDYLFDLIMSNKANEMTILYSELDVSRISSTELEENERSQGQKIAYPRYDHPTLGADQALIIQFPWIKLSAYGIPRAGQYYKNDTDRMFIKLPLDLSVPEVEKLADTLKNMDALFSSPEFCEKLLGPKWKKYKYTPIFREASEIEEDDKPKGKNDAPRFRPPYMKLKIASDYNTGTINTILFKSEMVDGKRTRTKIDDIKTIDEFASKVSYLSNFRPIARCVKFWAQPLSKKDPQWGVIFKIIKAEVEPVAKSNNLYKEFMNSDAFLDSDEEVETTKTSQPTVKKTIVNIDSDEDSDEEPVSKPKQVAKVEESDDESEEEKPVVKTKQVAKKVESDDDSEEEEKPAPKAKAPAPKAARGGKSKSANN